MQEFYDRYLPGNSTLNLEFDNFSVHTSNLSLGVQDCTLDVSKVNLVTYEKPAVIPKLRTAMEFKRKPGLTENLIAMIKRNFDSPELMSVADNEIVAKKVVDKLFSTVFRNGTYDDSLVPSLLDFEEWYTKQDPATIGQLKNIYSLSAIDSYKHIIKTTPKAKLDRSIQVEYPALQTIIYHQKDVNALYGPIFSFLTERLLQMIDSERFLIYTRKTVEDLEDFFSDVSPKSNLEVLELDISKYDKSQNDFHQAVEMLIWDRLGLDKILGEMWRRGHMKTTVTDFKAGIRTQLWYQRKSGDVTTFIGNTLIIAACVASITNLDKCFKAAFCGDDSVVFFPKGQDYKATMELASLQWNFNAKLFVKDTAYFCGKFIIPHGSGCKVFPDPLKVITRLGNKNLKDVNHVEELRISLMDCCKAYGNCAYIHLLDKAFNEVYMGGGSCQYVLNCIWKVITDRRLFKDLFVYQETNEGLNGRIRSAGKDTATRGTSANRRCFQSSCESQHEERISETGSVPGMEGEVASNSSKISNDNVRYRIKHENKWRNFLRYFQRNW